MDAMELLGDLVEIPGPVGQEEGVCSYLTGRLEGMGFLREDGDVELVFQGEGEDWGDHYSVDAKGNLVVSASGPSRVTVTAHMDEIGMIVRRVLPSGELEVGPLGGMRVWKSGEGPVLVMAGAEGIPGVLGFGSVHTTDPGSVSVRADSGAMDWGMARVLTGLSFDQLVERGVRPGTRVVVHPCRRGLFEMGDLVGGYFLDDRADLTAWLLALPEARGATFLASVGEEVGGEGARYHLGVYGEEVVIALELGPVVPDGDVVLSAVPTVWASDSFAAMRASDLDLVAGVGRDLGMDLQFQVLSRGGE